MIILVALVLAAFVGVDLVRTIRTDRGYRIGSAPRSHANSQSDFGATSMPIG
jgi:hypothetical protein